MRARLFPPQTRRLLSERRLRDWVALLGFDVDSVHGYLGALPLAGSLSAGAAAAAAAVGGGVSAQGAQTRAHADAGAAAAANAAARAGGCRRAHHQSRSMTEVDIYTDGACRGNPGPGGWAALLIAGEVRKEIFGAEAATTNNRMELMAAIAGLGELKRRCAVRCTPIPSTCCRGSPSGCRAGRRAAGARRRASR
jgi:hypothetical protein